MNKAGIRSQVLGLLNRNDCTNALADTFIEQALARIQRTLRVPSMEAEEVLTTNSVSGDVIVLPSDFLNIKYLYTPKTDGTQQMLEYKDVSTFLSIPSSVGIPQYYTRIRGELKMKPYPPVGTTINLIYFNEIPDLVNDSDVNFLTIIAPDLLTYGALTFAADYFVDDRKPAFEERFGAIYSEVVEQASLVDMDQTSIAINPAYAYPY
jgi:hypothetical protein